VRVRALAPSGRVAVALPVAGALRVFRRFVFTEAAAGLVATGLIGAMTYGYVRRGLVPLARIGRQARHIASDTVGDVDVPGATKLLRGLPDARTREIADLSTSLDAMLVRLEGAYAARAAAEQRLRRFVTDASHELRTPLASIQGYIELCRRTDPLDRADYELATRRIQEEALRMGGLVDDLLLLARLDQGEASARDTIDLTRLLADMVHDLRARAPEHHLTVRFPDDPVTIVGDDVRLRQALTNILGNAHRHTPPGTHITLTLNARDDMAHLTVADDGPGIPADKLPHIFERFYHGETDERGRGSGLGLAIVHAIITAHSGEVSATSTPGAGTVISVTLPLSLNDPT
jgi:two-component system OmpR family sensor kinase